LALFCHQPCATIASPGGEVGQRADQGDQAVLAARGLRLALGALGGQAGHGVAVLRVLVGEALHHAAQLAAGRRVCGVAIGDRVCRHGLLPGVPRS
jgi:hypothetical protein